MSPRDKYVYKIKIRLNATSSPNLFPTIILPINDWNYKRPYNNDKSRTIGKIPRLTML